ncbi:conserved hypothetical protein [Ahrensia sp. R2A130]|nr:conserved hypothetical protein [Ahrensia sp. R2A130]
MTALFGHFEVEEAATVRLQSPHDECRPRQARKSNVMKLHIPSLSRRTALAFALLAGATAMQVLPTDKAMAADATQPSAVFELFTSQGCSSCPPADKLLGEYVKDGDVLALSFHVDYWNYLGWGDTFSKAEFTERQKLYAASLGRNGIYTPQVIINGRDHAVGSRKGEIEATRASQERGKSSALTTKLTVTRGGDSIEVSSEAGTEDATLWVVYFDREKQVKIGRGENRGRTITYHNVVGDMAMAGMMKSGALNVQLPLASMKQKGYDGCAFILQKVTANGTPGAIIGAAVMNDLNG